MDGSQGDPDVNSIGTDLLFLSEKAWGVLGGDRVACNLVQTAPSPGRGAKSLRSAGCLLKGSPWGCSGFLCFLFPLAFKTFQNDEAGVMA